MDGSYGDRERSVTVFSSVQISENQGKPLEVVLFEYYIQYVVALFYLQYTCIAVSSTHVVLGANTGSLYCFTAKGYKHVRLLANVVWCLYDRFMT